MIYLEREGGCSFFNIVRNLVRLSEKCCNDVLWQKCDKGFLETLHSCNSTKAVMVALLKILAPRLVTIFVRYTVLPRPGKGMVNILFVFERCSQLMANGKPWEIHPFSFNECSMICLVQWHSRSVHTCWTGFESKSSWNSLSLVLGVNSSEAWELRARIALEWKTQLAWVRISDIT